MRGRLPIALVVVLAGCGGGDGDGGAGALGTLAVTQATTGAVAVVDVATGEARTLVADGGPYGSISISASGTDVAFARGAELGLDRYVFTVDTATAEVREIFPSTGEFMPAFSWLRSGWVWYPFAAGGAARTAIAGPGETEARLIGTRAFARVAESPVDTYIAYMDCVEQIMGPCASDLVVERPDGSERSVLIAGVAGSTPRFTPDGAFLLYAGDVGGETHLLRIAIAGGPPADLGIVQGTSFLEYDLIEGGRRFSPDGNEVLIHRDSRLLAVAIDGTSERVIADMRTRRAVFTGAGDVVYELQRNTEDPPDDTPVYVYSSFVVGPSGDITALRQDDPACELSIVSPSGEYVGYRCADGPVHRIDGSHVVDAGGSYLLGFDRDERGVVAAGFSGLAILYVPLDGGPPRALTDYLWSPGTSVEWPPFDYAP